MSNNLYSDLPIPSYDAMIVNDSEEWLGLNIGIVDADLLGKKNHRFPNLALMKISGYYKRRGLKVTLVTDYRDLFSNYIELPQNEEPYFNFVMYDDTNRKNYVRYYREEDIKFDRIIISKVFSDSIIPLQIKYLSKVIYGGTGFFYDRSPDLPDVIEHSKPDYILYHSWIGDMIRGGQEEKRI